MSRVRAPLLAVPLAVALAIAVTPPAHAAAVPPDKAPLVTVPVEAESQYVSEGRRLVGAVGPRTTEIRIDIGDLRPPTSLVTCLLDDGHDENDETNPWPYFEFTPQQWATDPVLRFAPGAIGGYGEDFLMCKTGREPIGGDGWRLDWTLVSSDAAPASVEIGREEQPDGGTVETGFGAASLGVAPLALRADERLELIAAPGTFQKGRYTAQLTVPGVAILPIETAWSGGDGSVLHVTMPTLGALQRRHLIGAASSLQLWHWIDPTASDRMTRAITVTLPTTFTEATRATSARLALSTSFPTTRTRLTAIVRVETPQVLNPTGVVRIRVDGRQVAETVLPAGASGRAVVVLPRLTRGSHQIVAEFAPSPGLGGSTSSVRTLRVLL